MDTQRHGGPSPLPPPLSVSSPNPSPPASLCLLTLPAALGLEGPHSEPWASPYPINWKGDGGGVGWRKAADAAAVVTSTHSNRQQQQ